MPPEGADEQEVTDAAVEAERAISTACGRSAGCRPSAEQREAHGDGSAEGCEKQQSRGCSLAASWRVAIWQRA